MKSIKRNVLLYFFVCLIGTFLFAGCSEDRPDPTESELRLDYYKSLQLEEDECFVVRSGNYGMKIRFYNITPEGCTAEWEPYTTRNINLTERGIYLINNERRGSVECTFSNHKSDNGFLYQMVDGIQLSVYHSYSVSVSEWRSYYFRLGMYSKNPVGVDWALDPEFGTTGDLHVAKMDEIDWGEPPEGYKNWAESYQQGRGWRPSLYDIIEAARAGEWSRISVYYPSSFEEFLTSRTPKEIPEIYQEWYEDFAEAVPYEDVYEYGTVLWEAETLGSWDEYDDYRDAYPFIRTMRAELGCYFDAPGWVSIRYVKENGEECEKVFLSFELYPDGDWEKWRMENYAEAESEDISTRWEWNRWVLIPYDALMEEEIATLNGSDWDRLSEDEVANTAYQKETWYSNFASVMGYASRSNWESLSDLGIAAPFRAGLYGVNTDYNDKMEYLYAKWYSFFAGSQQWAIQSISDIPEDALQEYQLVEDLMDWKRQGGIQIEVVYINSENQRKIAFFYMFEIKKEGQSTIRPMYVVLPQGYRVHFSDYNE